MEGKETGWELNVSNLQTLISAAKRVSRVSRCSDSGSWTQSGEEGLSEKPSPWPRSGGNGKVPLRPWGSQFERWLYRTLEETGLSSAQEKRSGCGETPASTSKLWDSQREFSGAPRK